MTPVNLRPLVAMLTLAVASSVTISPATGAEPVSSAAAPHEHPIAVRVVDGVGELYDRRTGERFAMRGANYVFRETEGSARPPEIFRVGAYDGDRVRRDLARLAEHGYDTVRVFLDHCDPQDDGCIGRLDGPGLNAAYMANVADLLRAAREHSIFVLLTSNDLPDHGGYSEQANSVAGAHFAGYRNAFYLTPQAIDATRRYWRDIITGLASHGAPLGQVVAWELVNEQWMFEDQPPLSLTSGIVETTTGRYDMSDPARKRAMVADGIVHYVREAKAEILTHDPGALVTMGFFGPDAAPGWYTDPASALARADLDFLDFHAYPGGIDLAPVARTLGVAEHPERPVILGEFGSFRHSAADIEAAAAAVADWQTESCRLGFDGWLYWTYLGAVPSISDATWGLVDEDGYLLRLLAPESHRDPCDRIEVERSNNALDARVRASMSTKEDRPRRAVDDDLATAWVAGGHPDQWIRLDLREPIKLAELQLVVSQDPPGRTTHVIEVQRRGQRGFRTLGRLRGRTTDGDVLVLRPRRVVRDVVAIRVRTVASPSWVAWREIRAFETRR
jgi:hypothetical protein